MKRSLSGGILSSAALAAGLITIAGGSAAASVHVAASVHAAASVKPRVATTLWVAPATGRSTLPTGCQTAAYTDINAAIAAATAGDTVMVCPGTYTGSATVTTGMTLQLTITTGVYVDKSISLIGLPGAIVNASTLDNGVSVFGINTAKVKGFTIEGALGEGILVSDSTRITVAGNLVKNNDAGLATTGYFECQTAAKVLGNCGYGLHLLSVTHSSVLDNTVEFNSGGILLTDQFGPTHGNNVNGNLVEDNSARSGIRLASDSAASLSATRYRTPKLGGVYSNTVGNNIVISNGRAGFTTSTGVTGYGSGVAITADVKGGATYSNLVVGNEIVGNGLSGITIYKHYALSDVSDDLIVNNWIGTNHVAAGWTSGIFIGRASSSFLPISATVYNNTVAFDHFGIYDNAGPGLTHFANHFVKVVVDFKF